LKYGVDLKGEAASFLSMARPLRYQAPGAIYHLMARGEGGKDVFEGVEDREAWSGL
jgi:hypothetical protein